MIGNIITDEKGNPLDNSGNKLEPSNHQPPKEVKDLFAKVQKDYQTSFNLQHRSFDEFDGISLLDRANLDQQTFAAFVGAEYLPNHKKWRFRGRKNIARNKLIKILSRAIAGMLYPFVYAKNEMDEEDKMTARVMRILVEDHLRKAGYKFKFLYMVLSALVNPAVFVQVEYVEAMQKIKRKLKDGTYEVAEVVDELLSGLCLNIVPLDEILIPDFYSGTGRIQSLPYLPRVRRISYDTARARYAGKYFNEKGKDLFDYVQAGKTKWLAGNDQQTLYDVEWNEADANFVQELTVQYRSEDLEVCFIGGVFMGNEKNVFNSNPIKHRRLTLIDGKWESVPVYNIACSGFEPLDPTGRFFWYKSGAFKEYWDDQALNTMHRLAIDGTYLDVIKPIFFSGVAKIDSTVMAPGATVGMPQGAQATPYQLGPNLTAAYNAIMKQQSDLEDSTNAEAVPAEPTPGITATQTVAAIQQAKMFFSVFALMIADLVEQIGALTMDCVIQYSTVGELDNSTPESLTMKYQMFLAKNKEKGKDLTNKIVFTDKYMGRMMTDKEKENIEWGLYDKTGGEGSDQRLYLVNPYQFARTTYTMYVDADRIVLKSMGADRQEKITSFNVLTDPRVAPFTDQQAVIEDFVIEEFGGDDPDKYKRKGEIAPEMLGSVMGASPPKGKSVEQPLAVT